MKDKFPERERPRQSSVCFGEGPKDPAGTTRTEAGGPCQRPREGARQDGLPRLSEDAPFVSRGKWGTLEPHEGDDPPPPHTQTHTLPPPPTHPHSDLFCSKQSATPSGHSLPPLLPPPPEVLYASFSSRAVDRSSRLSRLP